MNSFGRQCFVAGVSLAVLLAVGATAQAAPWAGGGGPNPSYFQTVDAAGTAPSGNFSWSMGQDMNGLFGAPRIVKDWGTGFERFQFTPAGFQALASGIGGFASASDTLSFTMQTAPLFDLTSVSIQVTGDFTLTGSTSEVDLTADFEVSDVDNSVIHPGLLSTNPYTFPVNASSVPDPIGAGTISYTGVAGVDLATAFPTPGDTLDISFAAAISAMTDAAGDIANMKLQLTNLTFEVVFIPEPGTLALLGLGVLPLLRRRRR